MARKPGRQAPREWTPFQRTPISDPMRTQLTAAGWNPNQVQCFVNSQYQVLVRDLGVVGALGPMAHLSIKRHDKNPIRDWRHLQRIKNELIGYHCEAVELYPDDRRLIDDANQFHLYALLESGRWFPFGDQERSVSTPAEAASLNARQRPFDPSDPAYQE